MRSRTTGVVRYRDTVCLCPGISPPRVYRNWHRPPHKPFPQSSRTQWEGICILIRSVFTLLFFIETPFHQFILTTKETLGWRTQFFPNGKTLTTVCPRGSIREETCVHLGILLKEPTILRSIFIYRNPSVQLGSLITVPERISPKILKDLKDFFSSTPRDSSSSCRVQWVNLNLKSRGRGKVTVFPSVFLSIIWEGKLGLRSHWPSVQHQMVVDFKYLRSYSLFYRFFFRQVPNLSSRVGYLTCPKTLS